MAGNGDCILGLPPIRRMWRLAYPASCPIPMKSLFCNKAIMLSDSQIDSAKCCTHRDIEIDHGIAESKVIDPRQLIVRDKKICDRGIVGCSIAERRGNCSHKLVLCEVYGCEIGQRSECLWYGPSEQIVSNPQRSQVCEGCNYIIWKGPWKQWQEGEYYGHKFTNSHLMVQSHSKKADPYLSTHSVKGEES